MAAVVPWQFNLFRQMYFSSGTIGATKQVAGSFCRTGLSRKDMNFEGFEEVYSFSHHSSVENGYIWKVLKLLEIHPWPEEPEEQFGGNHRLRSMVLTMTCLVAALQSLGDFFSRGVAGGNCVEIPSKIKIWVMTRCWSWIVGVNHYSKWCSDLPIFWNQALPSLKRFAPETWWLGDGSFPFRRAHSGAIATHAKLLP